ncbi:MAG TPA: dihydroorotate dehydrogenase-like protein [Candidatus Sulfotelmatobacter sp.]|nr:dihydroorotate dehydrogenase-like protein [Candidatus Sulfotelmatobacter sp.]
MDLSTTYLGLKLRTPLVMSASPLSENIDNLKHIEDAGASAIVMHSLFEEQLSQDRLELNRNVEQGTESHAEALSYFREAGDYHVGPEEYLQHLWKARQLVKVPIIASLNCSSVGAWTEFARQIQQAGADALELNIYSIPTDLDVPGEMVEENYLNILRAVRSEVKIPIAVKVSPFFSNFANMARRFDEAGADGLVMFNRFYQPDIDLEDLEVKPNILLSTPMAMRLPLRWTAILYGKVKASLAATSGIHRAADALKMLMAGADVTMLCSTVLRHGFPQIAAIESDLSRWLEEHDYESVQQIKGSLSQKYCAGPAAFERAQYMKALCTYSI